MYSPNFLKEHGDNLPTVRIAEIELRNFKSVKYGNVIMNCGKKFVPYGTASDILGVYGQNGSGKTSLIEAISILKYLLSGESIPGQYADCIDINSEYASLSFTLEFQYPKHNNAYETNGDIRKLIYSFDMKRVPVENIKRPRLFLDDSMDMMIPMPKEKVCVFNEKIKVGGTICGEKTPLKPYLEVTDTLLPIGPMTKAKALLGELTDEKRIKLNVNKRIAEEKSKSFIFMEETMIIFEKYSKYSVFYQMLIELYRWGQYYLLVVDQKQEALTKSNYALPIYLDASQEPLFFPIMHPFPVPEELVKDITRFFDTLSSVLSEIVPGLSLLLKTYEKTSNSDGTESLMVELMSKRGETEIPVRCESDGIKKLIGSLHYLITVYSQHSTTVAYDEFDSGIFEYLLGEILQVIQDSGIGQFIFTSHNMRPLEVLKKEFVCFTTTDPNNRYIKLTGINVTNNLRRVYYREIAMHEHYDNLYNETKRYKIINAMRRAGERDG